ncbi:MAG TPA: histidine kinase [Salinivirgaceae bacterium]|nr:histidine kinase [Salinivirgaceae bacterium]
MGTKTNLHIVAFSWLIIWSIASKAQIPLPVNYSEKDGLVCGEIYKLHCDRNNFIWISAKYGLFRFDGYEFVKIDKNGFLNETPLMAFAEKSDTLWGIDRKGKIFFSTYGAFAQHPFNHRINNTLKNQDIFPQTFKAVSSGFDVVFASAGWVKIFHDGTFQIPRNASYQKGLADFLSFVFRDYVDSLKIQHFVEKLDSTTLHQIASGALPMVDTTTAIPEIYTAIGKISFKGGNLNIEKSDINVTVVGSVLGIPFFGTHRNGIKFRFPEGTKTLLSIYSVTDCITDHEKGVWIATKENSLFYYKNLRIRNFNINSDLLFTNIADICHGPDGKFFIISENLSASLISDKGELIENYFSQGFASLSNAVYLEKYKILCGLSFDRLICFSFVDGSVRHKIHTLESITDLVVHNDTLFIASSKGVSYLNPVSNIIYPYVQFTLPTNSKLLTCCKKQEIMILSTDGFFKIENKRLSKIDSKHDLNPKTLFALTPIGDKVYAIVQQMGIVPLSVSNDLKNQQSLLWDIGEITSICQNQEFLFIATTGGIWAIPIRENYPDVTTRVLLNRNAGITSLEIDRIICNDSALLVKNKQGVDLIPISEIRNLPAIKFHQFETFINGLPGGKSKQLQLDEDQNSLLLRFFPCSYKSERFFTVRYIVKPYMQHPEIVYGPHLMIFLPGFGEFNADIQFLDYQGQWTAPVKFQISRPQPFYRKVEFYFILLVIGVVVVGYLVYLRIALFKRKTELTLERKENAHLIMTQQLNPHFTFNSLNAIHHFVLNNERQDASRYLTRFAQLMRGVIDFSNNEFIDLENDLSLLQMYVDLEKLRFPNMFTFQIEIEPALDTRNILVPPFLIQPFVENAIRHGIASLKRQGSIKLSISQRDSYVIVFLTDDGIGREESFKSRSMLIKKSRQTGLSIVYKRIRHYNEVYPGKISVHITDLYDLDRKPCGTRVSLVIPKFNPS